MARMKRTQRPDGVVKSFLSALPETAERLLKTSGVGLVEEIGLEVLRGVVFDVMTGINIRDSTETLTRRRLSLLNAALVAQYTSLATMDIPVNAFVGSVVDALQNAKLSPNEQWMLNWAAGLTDKGIQNVLRDDHLGLTGYSQRFLDTLQEAAAIAENEFGELTGTFKVDHVEVPLDWLFMLYLLTSIGCQTLTIRGSEKSTYGKLFEKLVLVSVLSILGFDFAPSGISTAVPKQFWLSTPDEKRESDATLLVSPGKGVYFDIGFIGRGNPEIILDKVSRFARHAEFNSNRYGMATYIIVDRIGKRSSLEHRAAEIDGTVIQMEMAYWPQVLARRLHERFGFDDELILASQREARIIIENRLRNAPLEELLYGAAAAAEAEEDEES